MNHIQRCLSALTAFTGALLAVFNMQASPSVAVDRAMPNVGLPSGDFLGYRCRGWPRAVAAWGVIAMRRAGAIVAVAAAATITLATAACGSTGTASGSSAPSAHHSASSPGQSPQVSRAQCGDKAALEASLTNLLQVSIRQRTLKQVQADVEDMQAKLSALKGDLHGAFSVQINALQSALTTLQAAVKGVSNGSSSVAEVRTAADGVTTATANLGTAFAQAGCIGGD